MIRLLLACGADPNAVSDPISHVFEAQGTQHVFYRKTDGHIAELSWENGNAPIPRNRTGEIGALLSGGKPTTHVFAAEGTQHLFYTACGHIIELSWRGAESAHVRDLSFLTVPSGGTPDAAGDPTSHILDADGSQHVFYVSTLGHVVELSWRGAEVPHVKNLNFPNDGSPAVASRLTSHVLGADGSQHVFYRGANNHIIELSWKGNETPHRADLTQETGAPLAYGDPASLVYSAQGTQHVFYKAEFSDLNGSDIIELWS